MEQSSSRRQALSDRAAGCIVGLACGDALARPLAGLRSVEVQRRYPEIAGFLKLPRDENEPQRQAMKGVHGALTTRVLAVIDSLLYGRDRPPGPDLARRLTALSFPRNFRTPWGALRGAAPSLVRAIDAHARGDDWRLAGVREPDATALVAALPLGMLVADTFEDVVDAAVDMAVVTHREPRSIASAVALVGVLRHLLQNRNPSRHGVIKAALQATSQACASLASRHAGVLSSGPDVAYTAVSLALGRAEGQTLPGDIDCRDAPEEALAAVIAELAVDLPIMDKLAGVCRRGGAADILVPVLAALEGARAGVEHLPLGLLTDLVARRQVEQRVRALLAEGPPALPPLYDAEILLAEHEGQWRRELPPAQAQRRDQLDLL